MMRVPAIRVLAIAVLFGVCAPLLAPTAAWAVCDCYRKGSYLRCHPSRASCRAEGGDHCDDTLGCRGEGR